MDEEDGGQYWKKEAVEPSDLDGCDADDVLELHERLIPAVLKNSWTDAESVVSLNYYSIKFTPIPEDRCYTDFAIFIKALLPLEAERMNVELHLDLGRVVIAELIPSGVADFTQYEILQAQQFQEMALKIILDRAEFVPDFVPLQRNLICKSASPTFYLFLPVVVNKEKTTVSIDWGIIERCLSSPIFRIPADLCIEVPPLDNCLLLADGSTPINDIIDSLVYFQLEDDFFFVCGILHEKNGYCLNDDETWSTEVELMHPEQPLLKAKRLFRLRNLLHNRNIGKSASLPKKEHFYELPPELCQLKILGLSKDTGSSLSLFPSIAHRLESLLVAVELKHHLSASFVGGSEVTADHILEALTTENCKERLSNEKHVILGTAFLKYVVGRYLFLLHDDSDEGPLTRMRSDIIQNSNLYKLGIRKNIQVYIRDQQLTPKKFFALGRQCHVERDVYSEKCRRLVCESVTGGSLCSKCYHMLHNRTIAHAVEALVGAFILDGGFKAAIAFLQWMDIHVDIHASQINNVLASSAKFMPLAVHVDLDALENLLDYTFHNKGLLIEALLHSSYAKHVGGCYERMEFLGDAVLDYLVTSYLCSAFPSLKPGVLAELRTICVNNNAFGSVAVCRCFHKFILYDSAEISKTIDKYANFIMLSDSERAQIECVKCPKVISDVVEAVIAAVLLDTRFNLNIVWKNMLSWLDHIMKFPSLQLDPCRNLLEFCQHHKLDLEFLPLKRGDMFFVEARVSNDMIYLRTHASSHGKNNSKKVAAHLMIEKLKEHNYKPKANFLEEALKTNLKIEPTLLGYNESPFSVEETKVLTQFPACKTTYVESREPLEAKIELAPVLGYRQSQRPVVDFLSYSEEQKESATESSLHSLGVLKLQNIQLQMFPVSDVKPSSPIGCRFDKRHSDPEEQPQSHSSQIKPHKIDLNSGGDDHNITARSHLNQCCISNGWNLPSYECCNVGGPGHLREFTFKAVVEIGGSSPLILESIGAPRMRKKAAADHAAVGALWFLRHAGYLH